jgi:RHH-type transcriptional regulator, proline utilization regulon repressor / proline dehydrogenase / delta 1-pyrroline-5-carboxylate dehydrogenase
MTQPVTAIPALDKKSELAEAAIAQVNEWLKAADQTKSSAAATRLAGLLRDPIGLEFAVGFVDGVVRPEDRRVAARNLSALKAKIPKFLPAVLRGLIGLGGTFAPLLPWLIVPIARRVLRSMVSHLIIDATPTRLGRALRAIKKQQVSLNINLLGEAVLGAAEADRRLSGITELLNRSDVDYVSVKVSAAVAPHSPWAFNEAVELITERLTPLFELAASFENPKFINLDMEEYKDLDLTMAVFKRILSQPKLAKLEAGIVLQAYLPDALEAMIELQQWAQLRRATGGGAIKVRVVKGANLPMEQVDAELHGWPLATVGSKQEADTNYKRVLNYALTAERCENVRIGVAGHNLFDLAFAWLLAQQRSVTNLEIEMLLGMAQGQAKAVQQTVGGLLLYVPVVHPAEFDVAIAYLIRRLEEGASSENFMSAVFELSKSEELFERERDRFLMSLEALDEQVPIANRLQNRNVDTAVTPGFDFANAPDSDPSVAANRMWARAVLERAKTSELAKDIVARSEITSEAELHAVIRRALAASEAWAKQGSRARADVLHRVGVEFERNRGALIEVMASEAGKTFDQADPEVSEAIDFAHYYAERALELEEIDGATYLPDRLTVVTPPWNFPVAIPAGSALAALAAGSAVIFKPARPAARCGALVADLMLRAGVPANLLIAVQLSERDLGQQLIADRRVDRVILTGGYETAQLFRTFRSDLALHAETSGKNSLIITPSADLDLAAKDLAYSAFGHAGQKCSAASIAILVGSVAKSKRFRRQLVDAVSSLHVDNPTNPLAQVGPIIEPATGKLLSGLTELQRGERWLLKPRALDAASQLWTPGIRERVKAGAQSHLTEYFGPVLAIMTAKTLTEALSLANQVEYGLTAGIHSLDSSEVGYWLEHIQAGNLYVNRGTTGAIVQRQPFGGWKRSAIGPGAKAGGPNYLLSLGGWQSAPATREARITNPVIKSVLALAAASELPDLEVASLFRAAKSDALAIETEFSQTRDVSGLKAESNVFRYLNAGCRLRIQSDANEYQSWRAVLAALAAGAASISAAHLPQQLITLVRELVPVAIEQDSIWLNSLSGYLPRAGKRVKPMRLRLIGSADRSASSPLSSADIAIWSGDVTEAGRIELLPYFHEQAISITAHRFGNPIDLPRVVLAG